MMAMMKAKAKTKMSSLQRLGASALTLGAALAVIAPVASAAEDDEGAERVALSGERVAASEAADAYYSQGYNIWFCSAVRRGSVGYDAHFSFGASDPFPQGSGQGQQARYYALQQAYSGCGGEYYCVADCYVQRFHLN